MGTPVPDWQTFIHCDKSSLIIRHRKSGLAENLDIPWPQKLKNITCEKVRFRAEELKPLSQYAGTLDTIEMDHCEIEPGALSILSEAASLRSLNLKSCGLTDKDFSWFKGSPKLEILGLEDNPQCTGAVVAQAAKSPLRMLYLMGTGFRDADVPLILSFPQLQILNISNTKVTGTALPQLAVNRTLNIACEHDREGVALFRAAQRQAWKKRLCYDQEPAGEAMQLVNDLYAVSQNRKQWRSSFVTQRYLDYCRAHGYNGVDPEQKVSFCDSITPPYQNYRVVDVEQISRKKFYVYSECDDIVLNQYRCLVILTEAGWQIDKNERLMDGRWRFWPLN